MTKKVGKVKVPYSYKLIQDGMDVVWVEATKKKEALREINHYAMMYGQDGPVKIVETTKRKSK